jgi:membrane fusion protein (multidrug efflux system)
MKHLLESGALETIGGKAKVSVVLVDGREYAQPGTLEFADVKVDPTTGSISLRAIVPNPKAELLPGMFVRARIAEGIQRDAVLVPQRAVTRDQNGRPLAMVVDKAGKVERRPLKTDRAIGDAWLVTEGLEPGEMVIVDGMQRVRPGAPVKPVQAGAVPAGSGAPPPAPAGSGSQAGH